MGRKLKYTVEHVEIVKNHINTGMTRKDAIKKAGFSDSSLFYLLLKKHKLVEFVDFKRASVKRITFI